MIVEGLVCRHRPKNRWMDWLKNDMNKKEVTTEMMVDRNVKKN